MLGDGDVGVRPRQRRDRRGLWLLRVRLVRLGAGKATDRLAQRSRRRFDRVAADRGCRRHPHLAALAGRHRLRRGHQPYLRPHCRHRVRPCGRAPSGSRGGGGRTSSLPGSPSSSECICFPWLLKIPFIYVVGALITLAALARRTDRQVSRVRPERGYRRPRRSNFSCSLRCSRSPWFFFDDWRQQRPDAYAGRDSGCGRARPATRQPLVGARLEARVAAARTSG